MTQNILKNALVGVEFEFYSNLPIDETAKELAGILNKKNQGRRQSS